LTVLHAINWGKTLIYNILKGMKHVSLRQRGVILCVCFMFASMLTIGCYLTAVIYSKAYESTYKEMQIYTEKTVENIEQSFSFVENTALAISTGGTISSWIDNVSIFDKDKEGYYSRVNKLKSEVKYVLAYSNAWKSDYVSYICIFVNGNIILSSYAKPISESLILSSANRAYNEISKKQDKFIQNIPPFVNGNNIYYTITLKRDFKSDNSLCIMIATNKDILKRQYASDMQGNEMKSYLINEDGIVFSSSDTVIVDGKADYDLIDILKYPNRQTMIKNGETYITFQKKILSNGLTLVNLVPRRYIVNQALKELPVFILISISLCAILLFLGFFGSYKSTTFIKDLTNSMNRLKGKDYDVRMPHYQSYSADILSDSFNGMIQSMKTLINDTYKSKILLQEMELEFIQQQINPHFLFNVLATIQIKAKMCSDETVYEMLTSLSGLLRASICSDKNVMVTLEQEFKYVQYYLYIQKQRYTDKLDYSIKIDDSLKQIRLPRLTIEPIVENCVIHGYDNLQNNVKISIEVLDGGDDAYIVISDNGKGFDVRELDLDGEEITNEDSHEKIGLKNTNNRLKIRYGNDYALKISSKIGKGTEVVIRIRKNIDKPILL